MKKLIVIASILLLFQVLLPGKQKSMSELAREKAISDVVSELEGKLSEKLGYDISAKDYLQALNHFSHGEVAEGKGLVKELALKEMLKLVGGGGFASAVGAAWAFDKWVWDSVQKWGNDRRKNKFAREFLIPRMEQWYKEKRFGSKKPLDHGYTRKLTDEFNRYLENEFSGSLDVASSTTYYRQKEKNRKFRNEMWELLLNAVREVGIKTKLKEASDKAIFLIAKAIDKRQQQYLELFKKRGLKKKRSSRGEPVSRPDRRMDDTAQIEAQFRALYPRWLRSRDSKTSVTTVKVNARRESNGKYFISIETRCTDDRGKTWVCASRTLYMTLGDLRSNIAVYKKDLGIGN